MGSSDFIRTLSEPCSRDIPRPGGSRNPLPWENRTRVPTRISVMASILGLTVGVAVAQDERAAKVRYFPEQREALSAYLAETTPSLNWWIDDEYMYTGIPETASELKVGVFVLGPDRKQYTDFVAFVQSASVADRGYEHRRAMAEGAHVFFGVPREDRNIVLYIDSEPNFSRRYRELQENQNATLEHFRAVHRLRPEVLSLNISFREEVVKECFPLLDESPSIDSSQSNPFGREGSTYSPYAGFRTAWMVPDTRPVWIEKWHEYYLVWRTKGLEE